MHVAQCRFWIVLAAMLSVAAPGRAAPPVPIPWQAGSSFSRTSVDDDVRNVLRALLSANGMSVIFRPGITAKVSSRFKDADPGPAFEQLLAENGLEAAYNPTTRTVTIGPARPATAAAGQRFVPLQGLEYASLRQMLVNFGIGTEGITYDPTLGMLSVSGDPARIAQITDLVKALEDHMSNRQDRTLEAQQRSAAAQRTSVQTRAYQDVLNTQTRVFRLRFADVVPTVRQFHGRTVTVPGVLETLQNMLGLAPNSPQPAESGRPGYAPFRPAAPLRQLQQAAQGLPPGTEGFAPGTEDARFAMQPIGRPTLSVDARTNSVIVRGSPAAIAAVDEVLKQLDQPVKMVQIEVVIATAQLGVSEEIGIAFRGLRGSAAFDTGTSGGRLGAGPTLDPTTLLPIAAAGPQAVVASFVTRAGQFALQAQLKLLAQKNRARVLSAPHLVTMDNVTARITRSQDLYVPVDTGGLNGQGLSQIQTGLTLEITPSIVPAALGGGDQMVRLNLNAVNSAPGAGLTSQQVSVSSQEVQTDVLVPDGGTFVVGGLFDDTRTRSRSGIPVLKDIPLLGALFRDDADLANLGETIFFITPRVIEQREAQRRDIAQADVAATGTMAEVNRRRQELNGASRDMGGRGAVPVRLLEEEE